MIEPLELDPRITALYARASEPDANGCRLWQGGKTGDGYATTKLQSRTVYAHRLVVALAYGVELHELPAHLDTRHQCEHRHCIEADHLLVGPRRSNIHDAIEAGAYPWVFRNGRCARGHDVTRRGSVYISPSGHRRCRSCERLWRATRPRLVTL